MNILETPRPTIFPSSRLPAEGKKGWRACAVLAAVLFAAPLAHAQTTASPMVLKDSVTDGDGSITIGDLFDNVGAYGSVVLGQRTGAATFLDAAAVQAAAGRAGAYWNNPRGLRRIMVSSGPDSTADGPTAVAPGARNRQVLVFTHAMNSGDVVQPEDLQFAEVAAVSGSLPSEAQSLIGKIVRYPIRQGTAIRTTDVSSPVVVRRSQAVSVTWSSAGLSLSMTGTAQKDAAVGDLIQVQNPVSKKMIDAVITGPGQALAGPAADQLRASNFMSSR